MNNFLKHIKTVRNIYHFTALFCFVNALMYISNANFSLDEAVSADTLYFVIFTVLTGINLGFGAVYQTFYAMVQKDEIDFKANWGQTNE